ncbi:MAG: TonB-dependent receptor [Ignavibacteriaceae bacterium]|nr:TonB-dependent receptor [Ignavibacteriaceae bacterium]
MLKKNTNNILKSLIIILILNSAIFAASNGTIKGTIKDAQTKESLPFSNVVIVGTSWGASSDVEGNYVIQNIPSGKYTIRGSYIGYKSEEIVIEIQDGQTVKHNFNLKAEGIYSDSVVITAQAEGQTKAINEQLSSIAIKNVVSAAKLQELPDANAAESVGRLPGVSLIREGGEGSQVVIRGLSPQYNQVTIDGVQLPGNVASNSNSSSDIGDRATDLSMISSNMLGGIEVTKAITPDMDASVIGGVVNFDLRKAKKTETGLPIYEILAQGGYNSLQRTYSDYKFSGSVEKRFLEDRLGVFAQVSAERKNLTSNELGAGYFLKDKNYGIKNPVYLSNVSLADVIRDRQRYGATLVLDYKLPQGEIDFMNFVSSSDTRSFNRSENYDFPGNTKNFSGTDSKNKLNVITNLIDVKQSIPIFDVDLKLSHTYSESHDPEDLYFSFMNQSAGINHVEYESLSPSQAVPKANNNLSTTYLDAFNNSSNFSRDRALTGSIDIMKTINVSELITAKLKFGGTYQYRKRDYDYELGNGSLYYSGSLVRQQIQNAYPWMQSVAPGAPLPITFFEDPNFSYGNFLKGDYKMSVPTNFGLMWNVLKIVEKYGSADAYAHNMGASIINDYSGDEKKNAEYLMATIDIGPDITILPGVRYQLLNTNYTAPHGIETTDSKVHFNYTDTTVEQSHGYWLPMVHIRYKPISWMQIQLAYTNTINYPDYNTITPRVDVGSSSVSYNNFRLNPAQSTNYDAILSIYNNEIGLFTIDGFLKHIKDMIYSSDQFIINAADYPGIPAGTKSGTELTTYINNPYDVNLYGVELDWQTNLWYLPKPFSGIVFSINYTHIFSDTKYPKTLTNIDEYTYQITHPITYFTSRILDQPNDILNIAIGYDYEGFSARVSVLYQDNIFKNPDFWPELRQDTQASTRWDLSVKQKLPWYGVQLFFDMNNITGAQDITLEQGNNYPASEQHYDMTADLGFRVTF